MFAITVFGDSRFFPISSRLVAIDHPRVDRVLQNWFTLPQVRLDIVHKFLGFRLEAARHIAHMTRRDLCGCFRALRYATKSHCSKIREKNARER